MPDPDPQDKDFRSLRLQRNAFSILAVCAIASIGAAVPRGIALHRELGSLNDRLTELQRSIVANQQQTRAVQDEILRLQSEISKRLAP
jgi:hypothetical protein